MLGLITIQLLEELKCAYSVLLHTCTCTCRCKYCYYTVTILLLYCYYTVTILLLHCTVELNCEYCYIHIVANTVTILYSAQFTRVIELWLLLHLCGKNASVYWYSTSVHVHVY